jgi:hypothetical protein
LIFKGKVGTELEEFVENRCYTDLHGLMAALDGRKVYGYLYPHSHQILLLFFCFLFCFVLFCFVLFDLKKDVTFCEALLDLNKNMEIISTSALKMNEKSEAWQYCPDIVAPLKDKFYTFEKVLQGILS